VQPQAFVVMKQEEDVERFFALWVRRSAKQSSCARGGPEGEGDF
jgi:hypothetical protein